MNFAQPAWLLAIPGVVPLLFWGFYRFRKARKEALKKFAAEHLLQTLTANVSMAARSVKNWLFVSVVVLCFLALARPQAGFRWEEAKRKGIDIVFAVDVSKSMLTQDVNPDRLTRAKLAVTDLVDKLQGDRVGLIAFAGSAFLQCPLTMDYDAFFQSLEAMDPSVIPLGGTNIASAIQEADRTFNFADPNHKILVILTDGEDLEANGIKAAQESAKKGLKVFTVGVGSLSGGLIPVKNESGGVELLKDENGKPVVSRLDESTLRKIAEVAGGFYEPLGQQGQGLETIYARGLSSLPKQELSSRMSKVYVERFQWPLAIAVVLLLVEMLMGERKIKNNFKFQISNFRKNNPNRQISNFKKSDPKSQISDFQKDNLKSQISNLKFKRRSRQGKSAKVIGTVAGMMVLFLVPALWASPQSAEAAYKQQKYPEAIERYKAAIEKDPKKTALQFNLGASAYKNNQFGDASGAFQKALKTDNVPLQEEAFYNLGNTQYRLGQQTEKNNVDQTIQVWKQALQSYENAMQLKPDDKDAKFNYEFVKKKLEELQKQQQQSKQNQQDKQNQQQEQNKQNKQEKQDRQEKQAKQDQNKDQQKQQQQQESEQNQNPEKKDQQDRMPQPKALDQKGKLEQNVQKQNGQQPAAREPQPLPGQLTKEEAKNLLDSLKGEERKMPIAVDRNNRTVQEEEKPKRDW